MSRVDVAFMVVVVTLGVAAFTAGAIMLHLAKALNVETRKQLQRDEDEVDENA